ncbi:hypothetical protein KA005_11560 [bacterium]|nr:hypothetical protein [bacterium]
MKFKIEPGEIDWWYWTVTLAFITSALLGWEPGYYLVMIVSALQIIHFWIRHKSLFAFDTQVRIVYFVFTLLGLYEPIRFPFYSLLLPGTFMVVFFDRCGIALVLKHMAWNKKNIVQIQR